MVEVLMFLFENYMNGNAQLNSDEQTIFDELEQVGFSTQDINRALAWLEGLSDLNHSDDTLPVVSDKSTFRYFLPFECEILDVHCRNYLIYLERIGILDAETRELVIDRLIALDEDQVEIGRVKWVVLMVLFNAPGRQQALCWMQELVLRSRGEALH